MINRKPLKRGRARDRFARTGSDIPDCETHTMEASRIMPDLQSSLFCEDVRQEANGNFIVIGVIGIIRVPKLPIGAAKLCVFNRWTAGVGEFIESTRLIAPDGKTILKKGEVKFNLPNAAHHATNLTVFQGVQFDQSGNYAIEVLVDEVPQIRYSVPVVVVEPPQSAE